MKQENVNAALVFVAQHIPSERIPLIKNKLETANDSAYTLILSQKMISPVLIILMGLFFGGLGIDRFLTRDTGLGVLRIGITIASFILILLTLTGMVLFYFIGLIALIGNGIWILVDVCTASKRCREKNYLEIVKVIELAGEDNSNNNFNFMG